MALLSVVIPTHNRAKVLGRALESVLACPLDIEVIVVDDASDDATPSVIAESADPRLRYERLRDKANGNVARNRGIELSTAPVVAFLDSDDAFGAGRVERLVSFFEQHPQFDAVFDGFTVVKGARSDEAFVPPSTLSGPELEHLLICHTLPLTCSSIAVRRRALREIGGFDPGLSRQQDRDILLRLCRGHRIAVGTGSDVVKHQSGSSISRAPVGYVAALDELVRRHPAFQDDRYANILAYLTFRSLFKAILAARFRSAYSELSALARSRHLPRNILLGLSRYSAGRRERTRAHAPAGDAPPGRKGGR